MVYTVFFSKLSRWSTSFSFYFLCQQIRRCKCKSRLVFVRSKKNLRSVVHNRLFFCSNAKEKRKSKKVGELFMRWWCFCRLASMFTTWPKLRVLYERRKVSEWALEQEESMWVWNERGKNFIIFQQTEIVVVNVYKVLVTSKFLFIFFTFFTSLRKLKSHIRLTTIKGWFTFTFCMEG